MPYKIKVSPKGAPVTEAQLVSGVERWLALVREHRRAILTAAIVLLTAIAAIGAALWVEHRNAQQALEIQREATRFYLDRPTDQPAKADENLRKAITLYRQVVEQFPRSPSAHLSLYHLGNAMVQINDLAGAIAAYNTYVSTYGGNKLFLGMIYQRLGYAYLLNGERDKAVRAFEAALQVPGALNKDQVLFELGKLEEAQSRPEGALARYQELIKDYPNSPFAGEASVRIKALEVKQIPKSPEQSPMAPTEQEKKPIGR